MWEHEEAVWVCLKSFIAKIFKFFKVIQRNDLEKLIHAFITTRLDYCNSLYLGLNHSSLCRSQQNAAAHLLTGTRMYGTLLSN